MTTLTETTFSCRTCFRLAPRVVEVYSTHLTYIFSVSMFAEAKQSVIECLKVSNDVPLRCERIGDVNEMDSKESSFVL